MEHVFGSHMLSSGMKITSTSGVKVVKKATKNGGGGGGMSNKSLTKLLNLQKQKFISILWKSDVP